MCRLYCVSTVHFDICFQFVNTKAITTQLEHVSKMTVTIVNAKRRELSVRIGNVNQKVCGTNTPIKEGNETMKKA